ncbi:MAG: transglutaminase family protein, partial [Perlucidibaca sp.]
HQSLTITAELQIEVLSRPQPDLEISLPWDEVVDTCRYAGRPQPHLDVLPFRQESPHVRIKHDFARYAADCFPAGRPVLAGARALMEQIHDEFTFDAEATHVGTPLMEVLEQRRGVCQDFAHLMIACLRSLGLPARYVSGYLLTQPPPGQPRLIGADASHAWISVWCPRTGWVDFDPTNRVIPDDQHITLAWGRDFSDVSPLRGVIIGGGSHTLDVEVTVLPLEEVAERPEATRR